MGLGFVYGAWACKKLLCRSFRPLNIHYIGTWTLGNHRISVAQHGAPFALRAPLHLHHDKDEVFRVQGLECIQGVGPTQEVSHPRNPFRSLRRVVLQPTLHPICLLVFVHPHPSTLNYAWEPSLHLQSALLYNVLVLGASILHIPLKAFCRAKLPLRPASTKKSGKTPVTRP